MLPVTTQPHYAKGQSYQDRYLGHPSQQPSPYGYPQRTTFELPQPLEPRPIHQSQSSPTEASSITRHQDAFRGPSTNPSDYRTPGPSLPGLRDILTTQPGAASRSTYSAPWSASAAPPPALQARDDLYNRKEWHPPLAIHQSTDSHQSFRAPPPSRPLELPIIQTSPLARHLPQSQSGPPYAGYPDARQYGDVRSERARQSSAISYLTNGVPSPYTPGPDESSYHDPASGYDRSQPGPPMPGVPPECQRKYLGIKEVNGEGLFHMYEGGFRIPTHVDGEHVNPAWGLTKANKPRKRLALACLDCREKKIKCEPGASSCLQCEKAKRPCRRAPAQQSSSENVEASPSSDWQDSSGSPGRKGASDHFPQTVGEQEAEQANKRRSRENASPPSVPAKKHRSASPTNGTDYNLVEPGRNMALARPMCISRPSGERQKMLAWEEDPYSMDPEIAVHLAESYFTHVNSATYCLYPRKAFMNWMKNVNDKCVNERMVLYAVLALGSVFADDQLSSFGRRCGQIAKDAICAQIGNYNLCSVQARLLMAMYEFAKGNQSAAWDYSGSAIRASTSLDLRLNDEKDRDEDEPPSPRTRSEFALTTTQLQECRRRTLWSCFLMDRYENGTLCAIEVHDIFLRLPANDDIYERGLPSDAPFFNNGIIDSGSAILTPTSMVCPIAWLVLVAAIWGDILNFTNRAVHRADALYRDAYESCYNETHIQLQGWASRLPEYLQYSDANLERSIQCGYADTFISMHAMYHFILIRLNRYVRHAQMKDLVSRNIRAAHHHAQTLLAMMCAVQRARRTFVDPMTGRSLEFVLATPFVGHAIMSAIDVVGAGGLDSNLGATMEGMNGGLVCLRELAKFWSSAREQLRVSEMRYYQIHNILSRPFKARSGAWLGREWGVQDRLETEFNLKNDCIYGPDEGSGYTRIYFDALKGDTRDRNTPAGGLRTSR